MLFGRLRLMDTGFYYTNTMGQKHLRVCLTHIILHKFNSFTSLNLNLNNVDCPLMLSLTQILLED
ncbi:hypothetical protein Anas_12190 [Armadillidium nasatum]|uniref:Uncharacterized protein n=1 Tax=Armadillidium nasatum TaxID=96803 RepID=A0A5N5T363_9CRUS|nr:hypothetical protein Anas_12190 [Armadillidium nasatum]